MLDRLLSLRKKAREKAPLIHCLTNHISINDCANVILAVGARPIMAEHPKETEAVTASADALAVNLGNITDTRMTSIRLSGQKAKSISLPTIIDLVGIAASKLRLDFALEFIKEANPQVIKGNITEIKALNTGLLIGRGIDTTKADALLPPQEIARLASELAAKHNAIVLVSGAVDVIYGHSRDAYGIFNGHHLMGRLTGTGCMLNALTAVFLGTGADIFEGTLLSAALFSVCGEIAAAEARGPYSFKCALMDNLYTLPDDILAARVNIKELDQ